MYFGGVCFEGCLKDFVFKLLFAFVKEIITTIKWIRFPHHSFLRYELLVYLFQMYYIRIFDYTITILSVQDQQFYLSI